MAYKGHLNLGKSGEDAAVALLKGKGYTILARNYKSRLGEIDIVAEDRDTVCFIEVKSRNSDKLGMPEDAVSRHKQRHISRTALVFLKEKNLLGRKARFDVVSVLYAKDKTRLSLIKNAFELEGNYTY